MDKLHFVELKNSRQRPGFSRALFLKPHSPCKLPPISLCLLHIHICSLPYAWSISSRPRMGACVRTASIGFNLAARSPTEGGCHKGEERRAPANSHALGNAYGSQSEWIRPENLSSSLMPKRVFNSCSSSLRGLLAPLQNRICCLADAI